MGLIDRSKQGAKYACICECGTERTAFGNKLLSGYAHSCGCDNPLKRIDETGKQYGYLSVLRAAASDSGAVFECKCVCGKVLLVPGKKLRNRNYQSCGCKKSELIKTAPQRLEKTHDERDPNRKTQWPEYRVWNCIKNRCYQRSHKDYARYGGAGITMSEEWHSSFDRFFADMGLRPSQLHSIDRMKSELGYVKGNCRWATKAEQSENRSMAVLVEYDGRQVNVSIAAREVGLPYDYLRKYVHKGFTVQQVVEKREQLIASRSGNA